jgi:prepilin signal peptidase PulO-like enzyme (type II secretory pathway)
MIIAVLAVLGLMFGSFVNALVWRLHEQAKPKKKRAASDKELSMLTGRSMCPHCKHTLGALDLIPLCSWLLLRGKCRYCRKPIDDTPLAEIGLAVLFVVSYIFWPIAFDASGMVAFGVWLVALVALMALCLYDLRWMLLPNKIVYPLIAFAALHVLIQMTVFSGGVALGMRAVAAMAVAGGLFYVLFRVSDGRWIGGGDVKLGFALGLLLMYPMHALLMLFVASLIGTLVTLPMMYRKKLRKTSQVPFGPFLIAATVVVMLFGASILDWYTKSVLHI